MIYKTYLLLLLAYAFSNVNAQDNVDGQSNGNGESDAEILTAQELQNYANGVVVNTAQGKVRGEVLQVATGNFNYLSFKGIPYAQPPVGDLRFRAPQPPQSWTGIRNATQHGSICIQNFYFNQSNVVGNEDCLYLNVYTPRVNPKTPLPVLVFLHGGSYERGSGDSSRYGPDYLILENVILVTINYRLGILGFFSLGIEEALGNAGLKDQVAALKWVQANIANFGGDPNKVTLMGQSVGGTSVDLHNISPMSKGLFKRSISMSGSPFSDWAWPFKPERQAFKMGKQLGLYTRNSTELVRFLKTIPAQNLTGLTPELLRAEIPYNAFKQLNYTYVVEKNVSTDNFLVEDPIQTLKKGNINNVDSMIGHTSMECLIYFIVLGPGAFDTYKTYKEMIVPRRILENVRPKDMFKLADMIEGNYSYFVNLPLNSTTAREYVKFWTETTFTYGILKYARLFSAYRNTYMYQFSKVTNFTRAISLDNPYGIVGATEGDDLLYLFHSSGVTVDKNSDDYKVIRNTCKLYANFAKYGNPTPDNSLGVKWPLYNSTTGHYMNIDTNLTVGEQYDADMVAFWDSIYQAAGLAF